MALFDAFVSPERRFLKSVIEAITARQPSAKFVPDKTLQFALRSVDGSIPLRLPVLYRHWQAAATSAEQDRIMQHIVDLAVLPAGAVTQDLTRDYLVPVMRRRRQPASLGSSPIPARPFAGELETCLLVDWPRGLTFVDAAMLSRWGADFDELFEHAVQLLRGRTPITKPDLKINVLRYGDSFESSRLLLPEVFEPFKPRGFPVAIPITVSHVLVAGLDEPDLLEGMIPVATMVRPDRPPLSSMPLVLRDGRWSVLDTAEPQYAFLRPLVNFDGQLTLDPPPVWPPV